MFGKVFTRKGAAVLSGAFLAIAGIAATAGAVSLEIGTISGRAGGQVEVPIELKNTGGIVGLFHVDITYDSTKLQPFPSSGDFCTLSGSTDYLLYEQVPPNKINITVLTMPVAPLPDGTAVNCKFTVNDASPGSTPLTIDPVSVAVTRAEDDSDIPTVLVNGAVVVTSFTLPPISSTSTVPVTFTPGNIPALDYCITEAPGVCAWTETTPASYTFTGQGPKLLYSYTKDAAGHISSAGEAVTTVDLPPNITAFELPAMVDGLLPFSPKVLTAEDGGVGTVNYCLTKTNDAATCNNWSATLPIYTFQAGTLNSQILYAFARDDKGQVSASRSATVLVEQRPVITAFTLASPSPSLDVPITAFTATDNGTLSYCVSATAQLPKDCQNWTSSPPATVTLPEGTTTAVYAHVRDNVGYTATRNSDPVIVDRPPVVTFSLPSMEPNLLVPVTLTASDTGFMEYCLSETDNPTTCDNRWSADKPTSYRFGSLGSKTLYAFVRDDRGQVTRKSATVLVEQVPVITAFTAQNPSPSLNVSITSFIATDNGTLSYCISQSPDTCTTWTSTPPASFPVANEGTVTLHAHIKDNVGYTATLPVTITVDLPPKVTAFVLPAMVTSQAVTITTLTASDGGTITGYCLIESPSPTNCEWKQVQPAAYTFVSPDPGSRTVYAFVKDNIGQISDSRSAAVRVDDLPSVSFSIPAFFEELTIPVTLSATDSDGITGYCLAESSSSGGCTWNTSAPTEYTFATPGTKTLHAFARDTHGNISNSLSLQVIIRLRANLTVTIAGSVPGTVDSMSTLGALPDEISCDAGTCSAQFLQGDTVNLTATPAWYGTVQWSGCTPAGDNACSVTVGQANNVTATFVPQGNARLSTTKATYPTIQAAYNAASGGAIELKGQELLAFLENLDFNRAITVTLDGGKSDSFAAVAGKFSAVDGKVKISKGKVIVKKLTIR